MTRESKPPKPPSGHLARAYGTADSAPTWAPSEIDRLTGLWRRVAYSRLVATAVIPGVLASLPVFGPNRFALAIFIGTVSLLSNLAVLYLISRNKNVSGMVAGLDLAMAVTVVAVAPATYTSAIALILSFSTLFMFWFGTRTTVTMLVPTGIALLVIGLVEQPAMWLPSWLVWLVASTLGMVILSNIATTSTEIRDRYNDLIDGIDAVVWESAGPTGDPDYLSAQVESVLGLTADGCSSAGFLSSRVHPDDMSKFIESRSALAAGKDAEATYRIRDGHGNIRALHERVIVAVDSEGATTSRRGIIVDETARYEAERSVRGYADFIQGVPIAMAILRLDDLDDPQSIRVLTGNPAAAKLVGMEVSEAAGMALNELLPETPVFHERLADVVRLNTSLEVPSLRFAELDEIYALRAMPLPDQCIGVSLDDVTKRARMAESLRHKAMHDHLTGLPNRAHFNERLTRALNHANPPLHVESSIHGEASLGQSDAARGSADSATTRNGVAVIMIDLNMFKEVNDTLGHEFGDRLLIELSRRLARNLRGCDTIARLGGDEFSILLTSPNVAQAASDVAHRVQELTTEPFQIDGHRLQVGASVGVAVHDHPDDDARTLMRNADSAMYRAKGSGGGIFTHSSDLISAEASKLTLSSELAAAGDADEFVVHYQPRIDLASLETVGVEALVRWQHPQRGLLRPTDFIGLAETSGFIQSLARIVTESATSDLRDLSANEGLRVSINISDRNLFDPLLTEWVGEILERSDYPASQLSFELTESQLAAEPAQALEVLHRLRSLGVRISVDHFGSGYFALPYLRELPLDQLKIDPSFIEDLHNGDPTLTRAAIDLGHTLGLHVTAAGVEFPELVPTLRRMGCDSAQGFHFAQPMDLSALRLYLRQQQAALEEQPAGGRTASVLSLLGP